MKKQKSLHYITLSFIALISLSACTTTNSFVRQKHTRVKKVRLCKSQSEISHKVYVSTNFIDNPEAHQPELANLPSQNSSLNKTEDYMFFEEKFKGDIKLIETHPRGDIESGNKVKNSCINNQPPEDIKLEEPISEQRTKFDENSLFVVISSIAGLIGTLSFLLIYAEGLLVIGLILLLVSWIMARRNHKKLKGLVPDNERDKSYYNKALYARIVHLTGVILALLALSFTAVIFVAYWFF